jgi:TonB family protein
MRPLPVLMRGLILSVVALALVAFAQTYSSPSHPVRISQGVAETLLLKRIEPTYPAEAKEKGIGGKVLLQVHVSAAGDVEGVTVISGDDLLTPAAVEAVRQWKYKPYKLNGESVAVEMMITVLFRVPPPQAAVLSRPSSLVVCNSVAWLQPDVRAAGGGPSGTCVPPEGFRQRIVF